MTRTPRELLATQRTRAKDSCFSYAFSTETVHRAHAEEIKKAIAILKKAIAQVPMLAFARSSSQDHVIACSSTMYQLLARPGVQQAWGIFKHLLCPEGGKHQDVGDRSFRPEPGWHGYANLSVSLPVYQSVCFSRMPAEILPRRVSCRRPGVSAGGRRGRGR